MFFSRLSFEATLYPIFFFFLSFFLSSPEVFFNVKFCNFSGSQLIPTRSNSFQLVPTCPNSSQLVPNCPKLSQLVLLCQNSVISLVPNSSQLIPTCPNSSQLIPTRPNSSQLVPFTKIFLAIIFAYRDSNKPFTILNSIKCIPKISIFLASIYLIRGDICSNYNLKFLLSDKK